jgi:hypothetical protein
MAKKKLNPKKMFVVDIDMKYSTKIRVSTRTSSEAKKMAWAKFAKRLPKNLFDIQPNLW